MALKSKFILWTVIVLVSVIVLGLVSVWNLLALRGGAQAAAAEYDAMDRAEATVAQVVWLRDVLNGPNARTYRDDRYFAPIRTQIVEIVRELRLASSVVEDGDASAELVHGQAAADHLRAANGAQAPPANPPSPPGAPANGAVNQGSSGSNDLAAANAAAAELEKVRLSLLNVVKLVPISARHHVTGAADQLLHRLAWTCVWLLIVLVISAGVHFSQYRALIRPLLWLRDDMQRSAANEYKLSVTARGDAEFVAVGALFNGLAKELAELYRSLEAKVIARSRELVRSERLASVGFLAAGVAHEINNPLSVIAGYAELAGKALRRVMMGESANGKGSNALSGAEAEAEAEALSNALQAQTIMHDEAFRCKEITSRLLSLARGGSSDSREELKLDEVARQVAVLVKGLKNYRDRQIIVDLDHSESLEVLANPTEMKQVLLNLTINALEAVPPLRGEVRITGRRVGQLVELSVQDNGKGMKLETLENVFEPFFTAKRGACEPGTGLGLSITHAIIENHGGRITAESDGPGRGSRFIVHLPAARARVDERALRPRVPAEQAVVA